MNEAAIFPQPPNLELLPIDFDTEIPLYASYVAAGFPSPAEDYFEDRISLGHYLVKNPSTTYMMRVKGNSMEDANIFEDDILVIDKAGKPEDGSIAVCFLDGGLTVKTIRRMKGKLYLEPANSDYEPIEITDFMDMRVWGIVDWVIHKTKRGK